VYANPKRCPRIVYFRDGQERVLVEAEAGSVAEIPDLPGAMDPVTTAAWIRQALAGSVAIPQPIQMQAACCLYASGASSDLPAG
jgi:anthranilate phosphoribosyltransferase